MNTLVSYAETNGIKLTQPEKNLLNKLEATYNLGIYPAIGGTVKIGNSLSNVEAIVTPLVEQLVSFVRGCNTGFGPVSYRGKKVVLSEFDRTRYLINKLDPKAYSQFID